MAKSNRKHISHQLWPHRERQLTKYIPNWFKFFLIPTLFFMCLMQFVTAHVSLTYPPARKYALDFLESSHTKGPCGMPKGSIHTSLLAGSKLNVTWHLAYPHRGGFRLHLLDALDRPLIDLTPQVNGSQFVRSDATAQSYQVALPNDFVCYNCTLRLLRQADEWSSDYRFWSCADVNIKNHKEFKETCSGKGKYFPSRCKCEKNFYGSHCQYSNECTSNQDCGNQGQCIDVQGTSLPRKQCYCNYGWHGAGCNKRSPYKNTDIDLSVFAMKELSPDYKVYWRLLEEQKEIEIILKVVGNTWVGFGWRPLSLTKVCKHFPVIKHFANLTTSLKTPALNETKSSAKVEANTEPGVEEKSESETESTHQPESSSEPLPSLKDEIDSTTETAHRLESDTTLKPEHVAESENVSEVNKITSVSYRVSSTNGRIYRDTSGAKEIKTEASSYVEDFHPMDCTDIVIGSARGMASRVGDYYTRDRSTPRQDEFYGGKNDLTLGTGFEENGTTTIIFRKKLMANDPSDHTLDNELTHIIWAKGQEIGNYIHEPLSGIETEQSSLKEFYQPDELKYHGHKMQRGVTQINFYEKTKINGNDSDSNVLDNECFGHWKYPANCSPQNHTCQYYASWKSDDRGDDMHWHIETNNTQTWTGISFSNDERMSQTDAIIGWVDRNGRPFLMDTWINGYSLPKLDDRQDIVNASGYIEGGVTILEFSRKRVSNDEQDLSFTNDHCLYLFFPVLGGAFNAVNKKIRKHETVPVISATRVCIKSCGSEPEKKLNAPETTAPNRLVYAVGVKLMNLAESFEVPKPGTVEFKNIAVTISDSFNGVLNNIPGYYKIDILNFEKASTTSMVANLQAMFDKDEYIKSNAMETNSMPADFKEAIMKNGELIKMALLDQISSGKVGSLTVDPEYLEFKLLESQSVENNDKAKPTSFELSEVRLYTVLGLISALIFTALVQASCTIYKTFKKKKLIKENLIQNSPWKGGSSNTNYAYDPYGETEENILTPTTGTGHKDKFRNRRSSPTSQQNTLQMSHSPTSISQMYYDNNANTNGNGTSNMQEYRSNSRSQQHNENTKTVPSAYNESTRYDRYEPQQYQQSSSGYSQHYYADRGYSLPRQHHKQKNVQSSGYYTQDRRDRSARNQHRDRSREDPRLHLNGGSDTPDFYFMPSQRKYSGEVIRVYVDYNKDLNH